MKKLILLAVLLCLSIEGFSQTYGVRAGYTISNLDFKDAPPMENKHRNSFYLGFYGDFRLSNSVSVVPELQFSPEGAKDETLHLDLIQMPVLFKFRLHQRWRFGIGPQAALKSHKEGDMMRNFHYSAIAGVEFKLNQMFYVDARYSYGVTNIFDDFVAAEARNTNIQLGVGYQF
ncbi:porin family protein [Hyunsoonleella sp. SJ7]|uniref:Porin family protein n=1 Tax=Hyunsoonleella aquatilis TaxID=2762758 RepID=A0A923H9S1_9FLAO|nr:porin family protein [Hyunsoonleella aquatilis]MBC3759093.1 porin family protein [Hyunsoonleella aquatilis]